MAEKPREVKITEDLLREYSGARTEWASQAVEDNEFRNGKQWTDEQIKSLRARAQEPLVVNVIYPAVEQAKALLTTHRPRFQCIAREDSDTGTARAISDLMSYVWDLNDGNVKLKQAIDDYYVKGMGVLCAYFDPMCDFGKGEIKLEAVDPLDVYIDPAAKDPFCQDANHIIIGKRVMESQLIHDYPEYAEIIKESTETSMLADKSTSRGKLLDEATIPYDNRGRLSGTLEQDRELELCQRYTKVKISYIRIYDPFSAEEKILDENQYEEYQKEPAVMLNDKDGEKIITEINEVRKWLGIANEHGNLISMALDPETGQEMIMPGASLEPNSIAGTTIEITPITKGNLINDERIVAVETLRTHIRCFVSVGDKELYTVVKPIENYPCVIFMNGHNRNPFPMSDVRHVKNLQQYINKVRSLIVAHASSSTNVKLLIPRGSMNKQKLEEEWGRAGTAVVEFDPELGQPIVAGPVPLPNELYKNEADAKADIEKILGIYALMQGDQSAAPQTYKGTVALDEFGQRRIRSKKDDIEAGLNMLGKVVIDYIQGYYTDEKIIRILRPNRKEPDEQQINMPITDISGYIVGRTNDVTVGKYDLVVVSGSTLPSNRWARFEYYKELYQLGVIDQVELLSQTDVADMEGVMARKGQLQQAMQQIQSQEEQIKKLQGDLQTAQRESVHDRKRIEVKEFEVKLAKAEAKAEMATQLYQTRLSDEIRNIREDAKRIEKQDAKSTKKIVGIK